MSISSPKEFANSAKSPTDYHVPRIFKLLDELGCAEKGYYSLREKYGENRHWINIGLENNDINLINWVGSLIPFGGSHIGDRIYSLKLKAGPYYPNVPPTIQFIQKVAMPCVNDDGIVQFNKLTDFVWDSEKDMFDVLIAIHKEIHKGDVPLNCSKISQDSTY